MKTKNRTKLSNSERMSKIKSRETSIEIMLRKALWKKGLRYRKNVRSIYGTPDIVFLKKKVAIFCDSEFWHGKLFQEGKIPKNNQSYWVKKFMKNIEQDKEVNIKLKSEGWVVLRFWETDIKKDVNKIATLIENTITLTR